MTSKVTVKIAVGYSGQANLKLDNTEIPLQSKNKFQTVILNGNLQIVNNEAVNRETDLSKCLNKVQSGQYLIFFTRIATNLKSSLVNRLDFKGDSKVSFKAGIYVKENNQFKPLVKKIDSLKISLIRDLWSAQINPLFAEKQPVKVDLDFDTVESTLSRIPALYIVSLKGDPQASIPLLYSLGDKHQLELRPVWVHNRKLEGDESTSARATGFNQTLLELFTTVKTSEMILLTDNQIFNASIAQLGSIIDQARTRLADYVFLDGQTTRPPTLRLSRSKLSKLPRRASNCASNRNQIELLPAELYPTSHRALYLNRNGINQIRDELVSNIQTPFREIVRNLHSKSNSKSGDTLPLRKQNSDSESPLKGLTVNQPLFIKVMDKLKASLYPAVTYIGDGRNQKYPNKTTKDTKDTKDMNFSLEMPKDYQSHPLRTLYQVRNYLINRSQNYCPKVALIDWEEVSLLDFERPQPHLLISKMELELKPDPKLSLKSSNNASLSLNSDYQFLEKNCILVYKSY